MNVDGREAYVSRVLLNIYGGPGVTNVWTDDLEVFGHVPSVMNVCRPRQPSPACRLRLRPPVCREATRLPAAVAGGLRPRGKILPRPRRARSSWPARS